MDEQYPLRKIFHDMGLPPTQKPKTAQQQEQDVECVQTKIWLWDLDEYEEFDSDYLNQIFPYKINKNTMVSGAKFVFHFLACSLHYWVELVEETTKEGDNTNGNTNGNNSGNNFTESKPQSTPIVTQTLTQSKKPSQQQPQQQKLGLKHVKFLKTLFSTDESDNCIAFHRWGQQFMQQPHFLQQQSNEPTWQPPSGGQPIHTYTRNNEEFVIIKYLGDNKYFNEYKQRMEVMFLFYIDGVSFVKEEVDTWVYFVIFRKKEQRYQFVGVMSKYVFKISDHKERHRVSQVFVLPNYQKYGHGKELLDVVYKRSLEDKNCFEITTEIPSFEYQCLRDYKQAEMILDSKILDVSTIPVAHNAAQITKARDNLLTKDVLREIKTRLKLPGHQIERIAHIFIYQKIITSHDDMSKAHFQEYLRQKIIFNRSPFKSRSKLPHITFFGQSPQMKEFYLQKAKEDFLRNQEEIQEILQETTKGYDRVISKLQKVKKLVV